MPEGTPNEESEFDHVHADLLALERKINAFKAEHDTKIAGYTEAIRNALIELNNCQQGLKKYTDECRKTTTSFSKQLDAFQKYNLYQPLQDKEKIRDVRRDINDLKSAHNQTNVLMPKRPGWFLRQCIGNINVSLYWDKYQYKEGYEKFKFKFNMFVFVYIIINWLFLRYNIADYVTYAVGCWYYSSLIIQENILVVNGSKIKLWWRVHHYLSVLSSLLMVLWPANPSYKEIRNTQYVFMLFQCAVQVILFTYQHAVSYKRRSLGTGDTDIMKVTTDGLETENFAGFSLITLILTCLYLFHLYIGFCIRNIYYAHSCCWYVYLQYVVYLVFFVCNSSTLFFVYISKLVNFIIRKKE